jgi:hypothetical protein
MSDQNDNFKQQVEERVNALFPTKELRAKVTDLLVAKRPIGVSRHCYYPYYKQFYAEKIKPTIDSMIETKQTVIYRYDTFCVGPQSVSKRTLYSRVYQSIRYLVDHMDTADAKYRLWRDITTITRDEKRGGVVIEFLPDFRSGNIDEPFTGDLIIPKEDKVLTPKWRLEMNKFLETENTPPTWMKEGLALSTEEIKTLKLELSDVEGIMVNVTSSCVKIIKL